MISSILIIFFIKESFVTTDRGKFHLKAFVPIIKHPAILLASLAAFALMVSNGTLAFALPLNVEAMERATDTTGILLITFVLVVLIVFLTPLYRIYDAFFAIKLITIGLYCIGIGIVMLAIYANFYVNFFAMIIYGFSFAFICPPMNKVISDESSKVD